MTGTNGANPGIGYYDVTVLGGERIPAFVPPPLPAIPPLHALKQQKGRLEKKIER